MTREHKPIAELHPHSLQALNYPPCTEEEDRALMASLHAEGQKSPVIILPDGTILDGHRRVTLLKQLGITEVWVEVRHDLANADPAVIEQTFLQYNFNRRQLHPLDMARIARRLYELEKKRSFKDLSPGRQNEARDRVGKLLGGVSGRNLQRYMNILKTPAEVQKAVKAGHLKLVLAEKIAGLSPEVQNEIGLQMALLTGKGAINAMVSLYVTTHPTPKEQASRAISDLANCLRQNLTQLQPVLGDIEPAILQRHRRSLHKGMQLLRSLLAKQPPDTMSADTSIQ